ncbi:type II secretion system F family protein [Oryzifoliimicrobium ureilyticus]|uniref:type II secretion system F family protein n=1 Tax=Oryzifoliimicrobium ureilyticus TaxID=3113724 RepID=UPI0030760264
MAAVDPLVLIVAFLTAIAGAAFAYVILFSRIEQDKKTTQRVSRLAASQTDRNNVKVARDRVQELSKRRKSVQDNLKDLEKQQQEKHRRNLSMKARLSRAGLSISLQRFYLICGITAFIAALMMLLVGAPFLVVLAAPAVIGVGLPRWVLGFLIKRRQDKFLEELPNALDVIVRSIKSGLPVNDAVRMIATEGREPVKSEFRRVIESQQVGLSLPEACARLTLSMPVQEVSFFAIVIAIQSQAGGNLSEALANLSRVLRERRKMKAKVSALSMEAKASACIIGALPFIVATLVYLTSPNYMLILFTDPRGHLIMAASAVWMSIGIFIMRNMVNFEI